ncbi:MAG: rhodanese-like domain-containing protein [Bacteroidota bacterium]
MLGFLKNMLGGGPKEDIGEWVQKGAVIIDVRTPREYQGGHAKGSKNIPLNELGSKIEKIKQMNKPIITCCASGARSGSAASKLRAAGIEAVNGGPWHKVEQYLQ